MTQLETETQTRLRRAKEALDAARENELAAIRALDQARQTRERAKERYSELFGREEREEVARRLTEFRP
jgi:hypothetical protein